jgi:hypothetical protein
MLSSMTSSLNNTQNNQQGNLMQQANIIDLQIYQDLIEANKNANKCSTTTTHHSTSLTNPENAIYVWYKLTSIFGVAFSASFGEQPDELWIEALALLSEKDINAGLSKVLRGGYDFAPNLSKFLKLCEPEKFEDVYKQERETQLYIERKKSVTSSDDIRKSALAEMRKLLRSY